ncbi:MAG: HAD family hydrolase, partial [Oscillospiraceae bacterium]
TDEKRSIMKYDGIIFDLDGTLWDSTDGIALSWKKVIDRIPEITNRPTKEDYLSVMGLSDVDLMKKLFPTLSEAEGRRLFDLCCIEENAYLARVGGKAFQGIEETLRILSQEYKLSIVSNCNLGYIEAYFTSMGTKAYFSDYESFGNTRRPKSENIQLVVARNSLKNPLYVGDTHWDRVAAETAGVPFLFAAYGFGETEPGVPEIRTPMDLVDYLQNSNSHGKDDIR